MLSATRQIHSFILHLGRRRRCCYIVKKHYLTSYKIIWKVFFIIFSLVRSFVRSLIPLCAAVFERIQFFITIHVYLFQLRSFCVYVIPFVHINDVQNKRKLWKRVWIRRTASVRLHRQCSNIHSFFLLPLVYLMTLGSALLLLFFMYSLVEFNFSSFWNFPTHSLTHSDIISTVLFFVYLHHRTQFVVFVIVVIFIYFGFVNAGTILFCASTGARLLCMSVDKKLDSSSL